VGNPHAVVRGSADRAALLRLGPRLETHTRFPERTNVQLVRVDGLNELTVLVWERGAGETTASGSSAVAAAAAAITNGWCESPVTVRMPGGTLRVELDAEARATLVGPAERICDGELV
jgi:diaminopimelate epimerase